jgi:hypothetical protein
LSGYRIIRWFGNQQSAAPGNFLILFGISHCFVVLNNYKTYTRAMNELQNGNRRLSVVFSPPSSSVLLRPCERVRVTTAESRLILIVQYMYVLNLQKHQDVHRNRSKSMESPEEDVQSLSFTYTLFVIEWISKLPWDGWSFQNLVTWAITLCIIGSTNNRHKHRTQLIVSCEFHGISLLVYTS